MKPKKTSLFLSEKNRIEKSRNKPDNFLPDELCPLCGTPMCLKKDSFFFYLFLILSKKKTKRIELVHYKLCVKVDDFECPCRQGAALFRMETTADERGRNVEVREEYAYDIMGRRRKGRRKRRRRRRENGKEDLMMSSWCTPLRIKYEC